MVKFNGVLHECGCKYVCMYHQLVLLAFNIHQAHCYAQNPTYYISVVHGFRGCIVIVALQLDSDAKSRNRSNLALCRVENRFVSFVNFVYTITYNFA